MCKLQFCTWLQVPFILKQLESFQGAGGRVGGYQQRHPFAGRPLVILADKDKEDMDDLVGLAELAGGSPGTALLLAAVQWPAGSLHK